MIERAKENGGINLVNWNKRRIHIVVTYDCNMNCSFCINDKLGHKKKEYVNIVDVKDYLYYMKYIEKLDDAIVVLLGGEPTLLSIESLKEIANISHGFGYKVETYTNGTLKEKLLELDGYIDYITISNYSNGLLPFVNINYLYQFNYSTITISRLITNQYFKNFEAFDSFVDEANQLPFNYDFSTIQEFTPNFNYYHPSWFDKDLLPLCKMQKVEGRVGAALYKDRLIKLPYRHLNINEEVCTFKLFPNGNVTTTWNHDNPEIDYKKLIKKIGVNR